nr:uncharacterized protein LOC113739762 isoform X2 [Coffea arabica]
MQHLHVSRHAFPGSHASKTFQCSCCFLAVCYYICLPPGSSSWKLLLTFLASAEEKQLRETDFVMKTTQCPFDILETWCSTCSVSQQQKCMATYLGVIHYLVCWILQNMLSQKNKECSVRE